MTEEEKEKIATKTFVLNEVKNSFKVDVNKNYSDQKIRDIVVNRCRWLRSSIQPPLVDIFQDSNQ